MIIPFGHQYVHFTMKIIRLLRNLHAACASFYSSPRRTEKVENKGNIDIFSRRDTNAWLRDALLYMQCR